MPRAVTRSPSPNPKKRKIWNRDKNRLPNKRHMDSFGWNNSSYWKGKIQRFSEYLIKVLLDTGKGKTKVCFSIIPYECGYSNHKRANYEQGGILAKKSQYSNVNECVLCFCSSQIKETNSNLKKIFKLVNINELLIKYENVIIIGDLKILNKTYGIMEASSIHPCIYCLAIKHELLPGSPFKFKKWSRKMEIKRWG